MKKINSYLKPIRTIGCALTLTLGTSMNAFSASPFTWQEEVLLHDGDKIIVTRSITRGGHGLAHQELVTNESLTFVMPGTGQNVLWTDKFSEDLGSASFNLMMLEIRKDVAYLVASPMGCLSYNKSGRPNPPYVIFKYQGKEWARITLQDLPPEFKTPNLVISSPDSEVKKTGLSLVPAEKVKQLNSDFRQPEFKTILREPSISRSSVLGCLELVLYKGKWIMPNDPVARALLDRQKK